MERIEKKLVHVAENELPIVYVGSKDKLSIQGTSKGCQSKWKIKDLFVKANTKGYFEDIAEVLTSHLISFTNIQNYVQYYACRIFEDDKFYGLGCYSRNFLNDNEQDISLYRLFLNMGLELDEITCEDAINIVKNELNLDISNYLRDCFCIDAIVGNSDRHLSNLSIIKNKDTYRLSPVYDNGVSCLCSLYDYPLEDDINILINSLHAKPFNTNYKEQILNNGFKPIKLKSKMFLESVYPETEIEIRAFETIRILLKEMEGIAWIEF